MKWSILYARLRPALAIYAYQAVQQGGNILSGILLIYVLSKPDYGIYALLVSITATAGILVDLGLGPAVTRFVSQTEEPEDAGSVLSAARRFQFYTIPVAGACTAGLTLVAAGNLNLSPGWLIAIVIVALTSAIGQLHGNFAGAILAGRGNYSALGQVQAKLAVLRLILIGVVWWVPQVTVAAAIALLVSILPYPLMHRRLAGLVAHPRGSGAADTIAKSHANIRDFLVPFAPNSFYFAFQGSIMTLIAGFFGNLNTIANVAAVTRFGALFTLLQSINVPLLLPRLSALHAFRPDRFASVSALVILSGLLAASLPVLAAIVMPEPFLWVLGTGYEGLRFELALAMIAGALPYASGVVFAVLLANGTTRGQAIGVPLTLAAQFCTLALIDRTFSTAPLLVGIAGSAIGLFLQLNLYFWFVWRTRGNFCLNAPN